MNDSYIKLFNDTAIMLLQHTHSVFAKDNPDGNFKYNISFGINTYNNKLYTQFTDGDEEYKRYFTVGTNEASNAYECIIPFVDEFLKESGFKNKTGIVNMTQMEILELYVKMNSMIESRLYKYRMSKH